MLISEDIKLDYSDVLIRPKRSTLTSRYDVDMTRTHKFVHSKKEWTGIPIMASNMDTVGTPEMHSVLSEHKMITCPARHYLKKDITAFGKGRNVCMMAGLDDLTMLTIHNTKWEFIGIDVANGYTISVIDGIKSLREHIPDATIVAGNVVTADMTQELILAGADFVMIGGMLAGHDECDGKVVDGKMTFYGMASESAMSRHNVPHREYRGVEGKTVEVPYRGAVNHTIIDILSGIRSACTYVGAKRLKSLSKCATFVRVNNIINTVYGNA